MRTTSLAAFVLALSACSVARIQPGPAPTPVGFEPRAVVHVSGSGDFQSFVGAVPFSAFLRWSGNGTIEARLDATGVTIFASGDSTWVVTPVPGHEREAEAAIAMGRIVITRAGQRVGLSAPEPSPAPAVNAGPHTTPPPPPIPEAPKDPPPCPPVSACVGGTCEIPFVH